MKFTLRVTFIRIPKNASTSIYEQLGRINSIRDERLASFFNKNYEKYKGVFFPSHCTFQEAVAELGREIMEHPSFCVIRNPYDRFVSMYAFADKMDLYRLYGEEPPGSFIDFARFFYKQKNNKHFFHGASQFSYITVDGEVAVKHLMNFEIVAEHFKQFIEAYNVSGVDPALPQKNPSERGSYAEYYCKESRDIVEEIWEEDFNEFNFEF